MELRRPRWHRRFCAASAAHAGAGGADIDAANEELNQFRDDMFAVGTLGAVSYVVKGLRELPGRKSILLISDASGSTTVMIRRATSARA